MPRRPTPTSQSLGPSRVLDVQGGAEERGLAQGSAFRRWLATGIEALRSLPLAPSWLPARVHALAVRAALGGLGRYYLARHRGLLEERDGRGSGELAMLRGLASGLGTAPSLVYGFNAFEIESAAPGHRLPGLGCTALALGERHTAWGAPALVYNHDFPPSFAASLFVRRSSPALGHRSLSIAYPTLVGAIAGVNERGLAVSVNQAFGTDVRRSRPALFVTMLVAACLEKCANVEEAVSEVARTPVTNGALVTLVDAAGGRAVMELSGTRRLVRREPDERILHAFNKYRLPEMERLEVPIGAVTTGLAGGIDLHAANLSRERRYRAIVRHDHPHTRDDIRALMGDHDRGAGDMGTLCAHGGAINETILSAILEPRARAMHVLFGRACEGRYTRIGLEEDERRPDASIGEAAEVLTMRDRGPRA
jgi:hypothetical protein